MKKIQMLLAAFALMLGGVGVYATTAPHANPIIVPAIDSDNDTFCDLPVSTVCDQPTGQICTYSHQGTQKNVGDLNNNCSRLFKKVP